jgi:hypothetical protein
MRDFTLMPDVFFFMVQLLAGVNLPVRHTVS